MEDDHGGEREAARRVEHGKTRQGFSLLALPRRY
jgi:hypothetical protein